MTFLELQQADFAHASSDQSHVGEEVVRYVLGLDNGGTNVTFRAQVFIDPEMGTNEISGDGVTTDDEHGDRARRSGQLWAPADMTIDDRDTFLIRGEIWSARRLVGSDLVVQKWSIAQSGGRFTSRPRLRGSYGARKR